MGCLQPDVLLGPQLWEKLLGNTEISTSPNYEQPMGHDPHHSQNEMLSRPYPQFSFHSTLTSDLNRVACCRIR